MTAVQAPNHFYTMVFEFRSRRKGRDPSHVYTAHSVFPPPEGAGVSFRLVNRRDSRRHTLLLGGPFERNYISKRPRSKVDHFSFLWKQVSQPPQPRGSSDFQRFNALSAVYHRISGILEFVG